MGIEPDRALRGVVQGRNGAHELPFAERVAATPPSAEIRGVFFHLVQRAMEEEQTTPRHASREMRREYAMYPARGYLRFVQAAASARSNDVERTIERWHARAMHHLLCSGVARLFLRRADYTPLGILRRLERSRALLASYGEWRVGGDEGDVHIEVRGEWVWIREAWLPAIASIFPALDRSAPRIDCELYTPFSAAIRVRW